MADGDGDSNIKVLKETMEKALQALDQNLVISLDRLNYPDLVSVGAGSFGSVRKATLDDPSNIVAVKQLYTSGDGEDRIIQGIAFVRELKVWTRLEHPHIVRIIGFHWDAEADTALFISCFEPMGTLYRYLRNGKPSPEKRIELASDTASGLTYLHELIPPICHGDLTSRNILITADFRAKLCDFGLSKVVEETSTGLTTDTFDAKGAARYRGPELELPGARRTLKSDLWAWSCVAFEIITDKLPHHKIADDRQVTPENTEGKLPAALEEFDIEPAVQKVLLRCWAFEPKDRPDIRSCLNDLEREKSRLLGLAFLSENPPLDAVDWGVAVQAEVDRALNSLSRLRIEETWLSRGSRKTDNDTGGPVGDPGHWVVVRPFSGFTTGGKVVVKMMRYAKDDEEGLKNAWEKALQLKLWSSWSHPNLVTLGAFFLTGKSPEPCAVSAQAARGSLERYLEVAALSETDRIRLAIGTAKGVVYLHTRTPPICHGNLLPSHVLVDSPLRVKLCGFTMACVDGFVPDAPRGSTKYMPPEAFLGRGHSLQSDMWGWATLCAQILGLGNPWINANSDHRVRIELLEKRILPYSAEVTSTLPGPLKDLLLQCWKYDPGRRPSIQHAISVMLEFFLDIC